ncbi:SWIM zinc finger family protein [Bacillus sp. FJAT-47783]|uniref:SWIM zinc finger family protein n=1 Tax=Bacillus sp. FJAT-47783 TaxID=2922712 RepID=UPI001FACB036|nr:SWIM zinc finger family protein [Bacillus sp. FJAT-47783]
MLTRDLNKEQVLQFGEQVLNVLSPAQEEHQQRMKKGLLLYRQGLVYNVKVKDSIVSANVQDVTPVQVGLDLDYFSLSTCSCPNSFPCRHMIAVFLYVYASMDRLGSFLNAWKEGEEHSKVAQLKKAGLIKKASEHLDDSLQAWYTYFEAEWEKDMQLTRSSQQLVQHIHLKFYPKMKRNVPWKQELKPMYYLHAALFSLNKMLHSLNKTHVSDFLLHQIVYPYVDEFREEIYANVGALSRLRNSYSLQGYFHETIPKIRELLASSSYFRFERLAIYRFIWMHLFNQLEWVEKEKAWLEEQLAKENGSLVIEYDIALLHAYFLQENDEYVTKRLTDYEAMMIPYSFDWFGEIVHQKDWARFQVWSSYYVDCIGKFLQEEFTVSMKRQAVSFLIDMFEEYSDKTGDSETFEKACKIMLPYSYAVYHLMLVKKQDFKGWLELQDLLKFHVEEMSTSILKEVEKQSPESLLPLLHRAVAALIAEKKRDSYKRAVKQLKKLKRVYKKLKKPEVWESYFTNLVEQHKRLRAFQEELKKGKLLDG